MQYVVKILQKSGEEKEVIKIFFLQLKLKNHQITIFTSVTKTVARFHNLHPICIDHKLVQISQVYFFPGQVNANVLWLVTVYLILITHINLQ